MAKRILIVDDEPSIRKVLSAQLTKLGLEVATASDGLEACERLTQEPFELVVSDLRMPRRDGLELLQWVCDNRPGLPVILITAHGTVDSAVEALKRGAFDFITKPFDRHELVQVIHKALAAQAGATRRVLEPNPGARFRIIGATRAMRDIYRLIEKVAPSPTTVLVTGESGTGKELVARALHEHSDRSGAPFIQINCGAIPENLFESELFGHERGAFTGAAHRKPGRFELAHGGTLFLDEVGELPRDMQVKILRALQERRIDRVGGLRPIDVDVRVVAATNVDLSEAVRTGGFREDLFYRLNVIPIHLPPLRERLDDVPLLVEHFLDKFNTRLGRAMRGVTPAAIEALLSHGWPGNIRELENVLERSVLLAEADTLDVDDLVGLRPTRVDPAAEPEELEDVGLKEYVRVHTQKLERARIRRVLDAEGGNVTRAARRLGISRKSLQTKMKDYGLRDG
ncbi:MAG: two-component system response regulator AtoC [Myxococcota bacterium]|jgi:two-component system response regulator AtoC